MSRKLLTTKTFDYAGFEGDLKGKLICLMGEINSAKGKHIKAAMLMGEAISAANDLLAEHGKYGRFGEWVELECGIGRSTAHRYMAAWGRFQKCDALGQFDATAMYALSAPNVPEAAAAEASKLALKGIRITLQRAKEIVDTYTPNREKPAPPRGWQLFHGVEQSKADVIAKDEISEPEEGDLEPESDELSFDVPAIEAAPHPTVAIPGLATPYRKAIKALSDIRRDFTALSEVERTGIHLGDKISRIKHDVGQLLTTISQAEPVCVCEKCNGKGCATCFQSGFWTRTIKASRRK